MMSLLESLILLDEMEVISSEDHGTGHLGGEDDSLEDSASDGNAGCEWAFLIDVLAVHGSLWGLETETDLLVVSGAGGGLLGENLLGVLEYTNLLLESLFGL